MNLRMESPTKRLESSLRRLDEVHVRNLAPEQIAELRLAIAGQTVELTRQIDAVADDLENRLGRCDVSALSALPAARQAAATHRRTAQWLTDLDAELYDVYHREMMRRGMARWLGGESRLRLLENSSLVMIVVVLILLVYDLAAGPDADRPWWLSGACIFIIDAICCGFFMAEFLLRLFSAESKRYVWRHHWVDFVTSIPIPGEAQLARFGRFARLARFARLLRLLRFVRLLFFLWRGLDKLQDVMDVKVMKKTIRWSVFATIAGAILIFKVEGDGPVATLAGSMWWSFTTVLTGGFGDIHNPSSVTGQILTGCLVVIGMVLVGVFTATLTSVFVGEQRHTIGGDL